MTQRPQSTAPPTVGDTIWMVRTVRVPAGAQVRAPDWTLDGPIERLGDAQLRRSGDDVQVTWPLVGWEAGTHSVEVPGPLLIYGNGREDSLPPQQATITVASVLPRTAPAKLQPQPAAGYVARGATSLLPPLLGLLLGALLVVPLVLWRRRRRPAVPVPPSTAPAPLPLAAWRRAGERGLLLERLAAELTPRAAEPDVAAWLADAAESRYAGADAATRDALCRRAEQLRGTAG